MTEITAAPNNSRSFILFVLSSCFQFLRSPRVKKNIEKPTQMIAVKIHGLIPMDLRYCQNLLTASFDTYNLSFKDFTGK